MSPKEFKRYQELGFFLSKQSRILRVIDQVVEGLDNCYSKWEAAEAVLYLKLSRAPSPIPEPKVTHMMFGKFPMTS